MVRTFIRSRQTALFACGHSYKGYCYFGWRFAFMGGSFFRVKIDCVPGRLNVVEFRIARAGIYYGQCSEICGTQHGFMPICIVAVSRKIFNYI